MSASTQSLQHWRAIASMPPRLSGYYHVRDVHGRAGVAALERDLTWTPIAGHAVPPYASWRGDIPGTILYHVPFARGCATIHYHYRPHTRQTSIGIFKRNAQGKDDLAETRIFDTPEGILPWREAELGALQITQIKSRHRAATREDLLNDQLRYVDVMWHTGTLSDAQADALRVEVCQSLGVNAPACLVTAL